MARPSPALSAIVRREPPYSQPTDGFGPGPPWQIATRIGLPVSRTACCVVVIMGLLVKKKHVFMSPSWAVLHALGHGIGLSHTISLRNIQPAIAWGEGQAPRAYRGGSWLVHEYLVADIVV